MVSVFEPKVNPFHQDLKAAVLEGVISGENEETYSHDEVWASIDEVLKATGPDRTE
jgi:hypothetical protein